MKYRKINFRTSLTEQWAAFFDLAGWTWTYHPTVKGAQPEFKVTFPCGHSECGPTHSLYVMVRPFSTLSEFCGTRAMEFDNEHFYGDGLDVDAVALFGNHPRVTGWAMSHGAGGSGWGEEEDGLSAGDSMSYWVSDADKLWELAGERIKIPTCSYGDCIEPCEQLEFVDFKGFSDGAGIYSVSDYCSYDCLILDFHRAATDTRNTAGRRKVSDIVASFQNA